ncbi:MAG: glycosyltransferase [Candidatus Binataceae bacterium]|nr:glycosyltransferase [Candidatus Binataceae bacterium]
MNAAAPTLSLAVLVPVYNEEHLVAASLRRLRVLESSLHLTRIEVIVVDDGSHDGTPAALEAFRQEQAGRDADGGEAKMSWTFLRHPRNAGKGKAIETALREATGTVSIIHDSDLEYQPRDILRIVEIFATEEADAVFGSRFAGGSVRRVLMYRHQLGNKLITFLCNLASNVNFTDVETCYKAIRTDLLKSIPLQSNDFRIEIELSIKLAKRGARIFEIPISYRGRTYAEGKKIGWRDGLGALVAIFRFAASDNIYRLDQFGSQILARLSRAPRYNRWMAEVIRPFCGQRVLEIGSGVGNLTRQMIPREHYVASDINPLYLDSLRALREDHPYLDVSYCDVTEVATFPDLERGFDTVICLNVVEHVDDDRAALLNIKAALRPGGRAIVLVPNGPGLFGTLDEVLGHKRRYTEASLTELGRACGLLVVKVIPFNRSGCFAWWLNGKLLKRTHFGRFQVQMLNWLTPLFRRIEAHLPTPALSLIALMERPAIAAGELGDQAPGAATARAAKPLSGAL